MYATTDEQLSEFIDAVKGSKPAALYTPEQLRFSAMNIGHSLEKELVRLLQIPSHRSGLQVEGGIYKWFPLDQCYPSGAVAWVADERVPLIHATITAAQAMFTNGHVDFVRPQLERVNELYRLAFTAILGEWIRHQPRTQVNEPVYTNNQIDSSVVECNKVLYYRYLGDIWAVGDYAGAIAGLIRGEDFSTENAPTVLLKPNALADYMNSEQSFDVVRKYGQKHALPRLLQHLGATNPVVCDVGEYKFLRIGNCIAVKHMDKNYIRYIPGSEEGISEVFNGNRFRTNPNNMSRLEKDKSHCAYHGLPYPLEEEIPLEKTTAQHLNEMMLVTPNPNLERLRTWMFNQTATLFTENDAVRGLTPDVVYRSNVHPNLPHMVFHGGSLFLATACDEPVLRIHLALEHRDYLLSYYESLHFAPTSLTVEQRHRWAHIRHNPKYPQRIQPIEDGDHPERIYHRIAEAGRIAVQQGNGHHRTLVEELAEVEKASNAGRVFEFKGIWLYACNGGIYMIPANDNRPYGQLGFVHSHTLLKHLEEILPKEYSPEPDLSSLSALGRYYKFEHPTCARMPEQPSVEEPQCSPEPDQLEKPMTSEAKIRVVTKGIGDVDLELGASSESPLAALDEIIQQLTSLRSRLSPSYVKLAGPNGSYKWVQQP